MYIKISNQLTYWTLICGFHFTWFFSKDQASDIFQYSMSDVKLTDRKICSCVKEELDCWGKYKKKENMTHIYTNTKIIAKYKSSKHYPCFHFAWCDSPWATEEEKPGPPSPMVASMLLKIAHSLKSYRATGHTSTVITAVPLTFTYRSRLEWALTEQTSLQCALPYLCWELVPEALNTSIPVHRHGQRGR